MRALHGNWAFVVIALNLVAGLWGLLFLRNAEKIPRSFWYIIGAGQAALAVQVGLGLALAQTAPRNDQHMFYGFVLLFVAVLAFALRGEGSRRALIAFASAALFIGVVGIRTMTTG